MCSIRASTLCRSRGCSYEGSTTDDSFKGGDIIHKFEVVLVKDSCRLCWINNFCTDCSIRVYQVKNDVMTSFKNFYQQSVHTGIPQTYSVYIGKLQRKPPWIPWWEFADINKNHLMTHCLRGRVVLKYSLRNWGRGKLFLATIFLSANHRTGSCQTKTPREDWHHNKSLQQVLWPQVVWFVSYGDFIANYRVEMNDTSPPQKDFAFWHLSQMYHSELNPTKYTEAILGRPMRGRLIISVKITHYTCRLDKQNSTVTFVSHCNSTYHTIQV